MENNCLGCPFFSESFINKDLEPLRPSDWCTHVISAGRQAIAGGEKGLPLEPDKIPGYHSRTRHSLEGLGCTHIDEILSAVKEVLPVAGSSKTESISQSPEI
jgi:hypothetical protein